MRTGRWMIVIAAGAGLVWVAGVGRAGTAAKPGPTVPNAGASSWKTAHPVMPDWAPKKPSAEFLRAARLLKPLPMEAVKSSAATEAENAASVRGAALMWVAAYEFFGTLSDAQIDQFLQVRQMVLPPGAPGKPPRHVRGNQIVVPVQELTRKQRAALDRYFGAWRTAYKGRATVDHPEDADGLLILYKMGARRDLSNVRVGFDTAQAGAGHDVSLIFYVTPPGGSTDWTASAFAQIAAERSEAGRERE